MDINSTVRLNKLSRVYSAFPSAFKHLGFENLVRNPQNVHQLRFYKGRFFKVFAIGKGKYENLVGIQNDEGLQILIDISGITEIKRNEINIHRT
jgi:hypothetical protein